MHFDVVAQTFRVQVWEMITIGAAVRALSRDRQADPCTRRAFRVAGVGNVTCCVAGHGFAWQAEGIVHGT